jgi:hypothetical protein
MAGPCMPGTGHDKRGLCVGAGSGLLCATDAIDAQECGAMSATTVTVAQEYDSLRGEIERRSTIEQAVVVFNLTAVGALAGLAFRQGPSGMHALASSRSYYITLLIPYTNYALARLWIDHHDAIMRIGRYIRTALESRSEASWETSLEAKNRRSTMWHHFSFWSAYIAAFAGPASAVLIASFGYAHGVERWGAWGLAALLTVLNWWGWLDACRPPKERIIPVERVRQVFEQRVRTQLNWKALLESDDASPTPVAAVYFVDSETDFSNWWMPWYRDPDDPSLEVKQEHGGVAIPVTGCGDLPTRAQDRSWRPKVVTVAPFEREMAGAPAKFDLLVYEIGTRVRRGWAKRSFHRLLRHSDPVLPRIVLDGNHHLAGALRSGRSFSAEVYEIRGGPTEPDVDGNPLPDLRRNWNEDGQVEQPKSRLPAAS